MAKDGFFGLDNKAAAKGNSFTKWEPLKDKKYIISILSEDMGAAFCGYATHFKEKKFRCKSVEGGKKEVCCTHGYDGNTPKYAIASIIVVYEINDQNKVTGRTVIPWFYNSGVYNQIIQALEDYPANQRVKDLKVTFKDPKMMNCIINAVPNCIWTTNPAFKEAVLAEAKPLWDALPNRIAKNLSVPDICELLGIDNGQGAADTSSGMDLGDLASSLDA